MAAISIAGRRIGLGEPPYIIAELSANHGGSLERAKKIIRAAAKCGADAIKFQAYTADSLTIDSSAPDFIVKSASPWKGKRLYSLYQSAATPYEWFPELFALARDLGITPFASAFDAAAVEMLERLEAPAYKIASFEAVDPDLIFLCAQTGKPLIVSTGLCTAEEIEDILKTVRSAGGQEIALLKCNSAYPADLKEANLLGIPEMAQRFNILVGYSDHTLGVTTSMAACALGACIIEKHFIDAREPGTVDSAFSLLPDELTDLITCCRNASLTRGEASYGPSKQEEGSIVFRRSLYAVSDIAAGETFTRSNIRSIRPGYGLAPKHLGEILGKVSKRSIQRGESLHWEMVQ